MKKEADSDIENKLVLILWGGEKWGYGIQFSSIAKLCPTLCDSMDCSMPGFLSFTISQSLLLSIESMMPSDHRILSSPFSLALNRSRIRFFSNESALHTRWQKYWSFSISPSNEYSGLISFSIDWFDLLAIQGTLESLLQYQSLKASILWHAAFFMVQIYIWLLEKP